MKKADMKMIVKAAKKIMKAQKISTKSNDSKPFMWWKKIERDVVVKGLSLNEFSIAAQKKRQRERLREVARLKKLRETIATKKAEREVQRSFNEADDYGFEKGDKEFCYSQTKIKSRIRLSQGRAKPFDLLYKYVTDECFDVDDDPLRVLKGLKEKELEELFEDIKKHVDCLETRDAEFEYWEALRVVCEWEIIKYNALACFSTDTDVQNVLDGKNHTELLVLEYQIESKMRCGEAKVVEFWEAILRQLPLYKAKARLKEIISGKNVKKQDLDQIKEEKDDEILVTTDEEVNIDTVNPGGGRKPKYLNHVRTGYVWNKYNRTHYDHDNPPPKMVLGYQFNIFYSDLVDKTMCPRYFFEEDGDSKETCILRFHSGLPYEDVTFRIVNKEIDCSRDRGYKCTFDGSVLRLYFNFKRFNYRR